MNFAETSNNLLLFVLATWAQATYLLLQYGISKNNRIAERHLSLRRMASPSKTRFRLSGNTAFNTLPFQHSNITLLTISLETTSGG